MPTADRRRGPLRRVADGGRPRRPGAGGRAPRQGVGERRGACVRRRCRRVTSAVPATSSPPAAHAVGIDRAAAHRAAFLEAGSTEPSLASVARSAAERRSCAIDLSPPPCAAPTLSTAPWLLAIEPPAAAAAAAAAAFVGAAEVRDEARLERVAQLAQDDALLVVAQLGQRHRDARARRDKRGSWEAAFRASGQF